MLRDMAVIYISSEGARGPRLSKMGYIGREAPTRTSATRVYEDTASARGASSIIFKDRSCHDT